MYVFSASLSWVQATLVTQDDYLIRVQADLAGCRSQDTSNQVCESAFARTIVPYYSNDFAPSYPKAHIIYSPESFGRRWLLLFLSVTSFKMS